MSLKFIDSLHMQTKQSHLDSSLPASFVRSSSHFASRFEHSKFTPFANTFATIATDPDPQEEVRPEVEIPENILMIVARRQAERTSSENSTIMKYLQKKGIFRFLTEKLSIDAVKNIIRNGNLKVYSPGEIFLTEGKKVRSVDILLFGQACIISHLQHNDESDGSGSGDEDDIRETVRKEKDCDEFALGQKMDTLIQRVGRQSKKYKVRQGSNKRGKDEMYGSILFRKQNLSVIDEIDLQACSKKHAQCFLDFDVLFDYEPKHSLTLAAHELVSVFSVPLEIFYQSLLLKYNNELNQKLKLFRKVPVFDAFQNSKLRTLIERLSVKQFKKGQMIYRQGEQPRCFYMLITGQVQISKTINIFSQNPNNLYKNRMRVSRQQVGRQIKILPYANFNRVYNYVPEQKVITLAQVTPICIFGEEQIVDNRHRQVNARVLSLTAQCYQIQLQYIDDLCSRNIGANGQKKLTLQGFLAMMQESVTLKKILFRQNQLSDLVSYQNRCKYSTLLQGKPRRARSLNRAKPPPPSLQISREKQPEEAPPQFNNFNFTEFMREDVQEDTVAAAQLNEEQTRVAKLTHVKLSQAQQAKPRQKSIRLRSFSRELSNRAKMTLDCFATVDSISNKITLQQPLFTVNYFEKQFRQQKKLYMQAKKKRLQNIYKHSPQRSVRLQ